MIRNMNSSVFYWEYCLRSRASLNAKTERHEVRGALIKAGHGYGCINPWPELGDATLDEELDNLRNGFPLVLGQRALQCAAIDGEARKKRLSLFDSLEMPVCHGHLSGDDWETVAGFSVVKVKVDGSRMLRLRDLLAKANENFQRVRLDFNGTGNARILASWWKSLKTVEKELIDFVEDPCPFDKADWRMMMDEGLPLAMDRSQKSAKHGYDVAVIKPALEDIDLILQSERSDRRLVVTSYMDHAVGQMYAAYECARLRQFDLRADMFHGLATHSLFEKDPFFDRVEMNDGQLCAPEGTGLGFDDLLEDIPWKPL